MWDSNPHKIEISPVFSLFFSRSDLFREAVGLVSKNESYITDGTIARLFFPYMLLRRIFFFFLLVSCCPGVAQLQRFQAALC